jgi:hypothetical protein
MGVVRSTMTYWFERECQDDLAEIGMNALHFLEQGFPAGISPLKAGPAQAESDSLPVA